MSTPQRTPVVVYSARSKEEEAGKDSTGDQVREIREAVKGVAGRFFYGEPHEDHASGFKGNRGPGLKDAIAEAERAAQEHGHAELWAFATNRLARGTGKLGEARAYGLLFYELRAKGVTIRTVADDEFATNEMLVGFASRMSSKYSEDMSAHVSRGKRAIYEDGWSQGGPTPEGYEPLYETDAQGKRRRVGYRFTAEIETIREVGALADRGVGDPSIARELNARGMFRKSGKPWQRRDVQDVLTNRFYAGCAVWRRGQADEDWHPNGKQPALWDLETFERRLRERDGRDKAKGSARRQKGRPNSNHALGNGLAVCRRCGEKMRPRTSPYRRKDGTRRRTYLCRHVADGTGLCNAPEIHAEIVDSAVIANLHGYLGDFDAWREQIEDQQAGQRAALGREVEKAERELREVDRLVTKLEADYEKLSGDEAAAVLRILTRRHADRDRAERRLQATRDALATVPTEAPADAMLDFYNSLAAAVRGRLDSADSMRRVNEALADIFAMFQLGTYDDGVVIVPVLPETTFVWGVEPKTEPTPIAPPLQPIEANLVGSHE